MTVQDEKNIKRKKSKMKGVQYGKSAARKKKKSER